MFDGVNSLASVSISLKLLFVRNVSIIDVFLALHPVIQNSLVAGSGPEVIIFFSYSTQLSMKCFLLINIKMPTIVGILIFIYRKNFMLSSALQEKKV